MVTETDTTTQPRIPLTKDRVFSAAIKIADQDGLDALTMRHLAEELGVEAMSLYYHVANKEAVLDGIIDAIMGEIEEAAGGFGPKDDNLDWKSALRQRILTARSVMLRHKWAPSVFETRTTISPVAMRYFDALLGIVREGGFSYDLAHHGMHALGSRSLGFTQELFEPENPDETDAEEANAMMEQMADQLPYMVGMMMEISHDDPDSTIGWCDDDTEFNFALDLILDGLERLRIAS